MLMTWRGLWLCWRAPLVGALLGVLLGVGALVCLPSPAGASEGPTAELRDVVSVLRDINTSIRGVAEALRDVERAIKEKK